MRLPRLEWIEPDGRLIIVARALRTFAQSSVAVLMAIYLSLRGLSLFEIGAFLTLGSAGAAAAAAVVGTVGDVVGRRRILIVLSLLMSLTGTALVVSDNFLVLAAATFLGSFSAMAASAGGLGSLEQAILAISAPPRKRTDLFALNSFVAAAAGSLGALASGLPVVFQRYFGAGEIASFRPLLLGHTCVGLLTALIYSRLSARIEVTLGVSRWANPFGLPSRRRIFTLSGLFAVDSFGTGLVVESLASYWFFTKFGLQLESLGPLFFTSSVLTAVSLWVAARLATRIGLVNTMVFTHIPSSLLLIAMVFAPVAWVAMLFWLLRAFFGQMDVPTSQSYTMAVVGPTERTAMASSSTVFRSAGLAAGPTVATALWAATSASVPFVCGALVKITYDLTLWRLFRRVTPAEELPLQR